MNNGKITIGMDCIGLGVGAVIMNDLGEVLLMKRSKNLSKDRTTAGLWSIPGGEVEFGEKVSDAIKREVREELDVEIVVKKIIGNWDQILPKSKVHWHSVSFLCKIKNGVPKIMEPDKFNLEQIDFAPAERAGIGSLARIPHITSEMTGDDVMSDTPVVPTVDRSQIIRELTVADAPILPMVVLGGVG